MTKPQTKKTITLETIIETFEKFSLKEAREILYNHIGASLRISGKVEKVIKRDSGLKLYIKPEGKEFMVFAEFNDERECEKIKAQKVRKGSRTEVTGEFRTAGYCAATMNYCYSN